MDELLRITHRERPEEQEVHEAEDCRDGTDAERERHHGRRGEAASATHGAHGEPEVSPELIDKPKPARVSTGFLPTHHVTELLARSA